MKVKKLRQALEGVDDNLEVWVGYEGTANNWGVEAGVETHDHLPIAEPGQPRTVFMIATV